MLGSKVLFLLMMLAENLKACSSALITCVLGPSAYSKIPPAIQNNSTFEPKFVSQTYAARMRKFLECLQMEQGLLEDLSCTERKM